LDPYCGPAIHRLRCFLDGTTAPAFFDDNSQITTTIQNGFVVVAVLVSDGTIVGSLALLWLGKSEEEKDISSLDRLVS
jgi:hypothetical protein